MHCASAACACCVQLHFTVTGTQGTGAPAETGKVSTDQVSPGEVSAGEVSAGQVSADGTLHVENLLSEDCSLQLHAIRGSPI